MGRTGPKCTHSVTPKGLISVQVTHQHYRGLIPSRSSKIPGTAEEAEAAPDQTTWEHWTKPWCPARRCPCRPTNAAPPRQHSKSCNHSTEIHLEKKDFTSVEGLPLGKPICRELGVGKRFIMRGSHTAVPCRLRLAPDCSKALVCSPLPQPSQTHKHPVQTASCGPRPDLQLGW